MNSGVNRDWRRNGTIFKSAAIMVAKNSSTLTCGSGRKLSVRSIRKICLGGELAIRYLTGRY